MKLSLAKNQGFEMGEILVTLVDIIDKGKQIRIDLSTGWEVSNGVHPMTPV